MTRSYLAGTHHALAALGSNRDGKKGKRQIVRGLLGDEAGPPGSIAVFPGTTHAPQPFAAQSNKVQARFGVHAITFGGARGMSKGQQSEALAQQGLHDIPALTQPQLAKLLRTGILQMDLCDPEVAEGLAEEGLRYGRRRHPGRAQDMRATRPAKLATRQAQGAQQNQDRTAHPRANAQGARPQLMARAEKLRLADWVELTIAERTLTLTVQEDEQTEAAQLDGCYGLKTDLTPAQAPKELVHDRDKALAAVEQAFRTCKTAPLAVRPIFVRRKARPRAHALVVMLAYQIMRSLASCWSACDVTVAAGLHPLPRLGLGAGTPQHPPRYHCLPTPHDAIARLLHSADITLPKAFALSGVRVSTKKNLQSERMPQCIPLLH